MRFQHHKSSAYFFYQFSVFDSDITANRINVSTNQRQNQDVKSSAKICIRPKQINKNNCNVDINRIDFFTVPATCHAVMQSSDSLKCNGHF